MSQTSKTEDTIDLKELFFSLIAQWKLIVLCILISLVCALIYLRVTPNTYSVDALVQVEDTKSAASAALLGELSKMVDQKSPAEAEIQVLTSRMVLGQVIHNLNLDITIKNHDDTFFNRLLSQDKQN
ncbi:Wzz/FepE/Etk N-terminal domain-containing protein, partial [Acinetobacter baumannii]|nr:tyrosine protein kinase [Acinetobacter baumannii]